MSQHNRGLTFTLPFPLILEGGGLLDEVQVAYRTWGRLQASRDNAVLVCHALTGNADADEWWEPLIGTGRALDPDRDFIVCSNILGSCYGTTGPSTYGPGFPRITVRDIVAVQRALVRHLGIRRLRLVIGGSFGGMQALEWALCAPDVVQSIAPIATSGRQSRWTGAWNEAQRQAITLDPVRGLAVAHMIARSISRNRNSPLHVHTNAGNRLDAETYVTLTHAVDSHDVARGRGSYESVLGSIRQPALVVSIDSDVLYPPVEQEDLAVLMPNTTLHTIRSPHGHDGFLVDGAKINEAVLEWRSRLKRFRRARRTEGSAGVLAG